VKVFLSSNHPLFIVHKKTKKVKRIVQPSFDFEIKKNLQIILDSVSLNFRKPVFIFLDIGDIGWRWFKNAKYTEKKE
jgi:hypothetical protein